MHGKRWDNRELKNLLYSEKKPVILQAFFIIYGRNYFTMILPVLYAVVF